MWKIWREMEIYKNFGDKVLPYDHTLEWKEENDRMQHYTKAQNWQTLVSGYGREEKKTIHQRGGSGCLHSYKHTCSLLFIFFIASLLWNIMKISTLFLSGQKIKLFQVSSLLLILTHYCIFSKCMYSKTLSFFIRLYFVTFSLLSY